MKCVYTLGKLFAFTLILLTSVLNLAGAQEVPLAQNGQVASSLSGKVVDTEGKPVSDFSFSFQSMQLIGGFPQPAGIVPQFVLEQLDGEVPPAVPNPAILVKTEDDGSFKASEIQPGMVQIMTIPDIMLNAFKKNELNEPQQVHRQQIEALRFGRMKTEMQILSIRLNKITFYVPDDHGPFQNLTFGLKHGTVIKDVKITVKRLLIIHAKIVYADAHLLSMLTHVYPLKHRGGRV